MAFPDTRYTIIPDHALFGSTRRPGRPIAPAVRFIVAHDTGNPGASARAHAKWYRNDPNPPLSTVASAHLFVDDHEIIETIPAFTKPEQALHVLRNRKTDNVLYGVDANQAAIGVEYCFGGSIDADQAYARFIWLMAHLCHVHGLDPSRDIVGHQVLDPGRKTDPGQSLRRSGRSYEGMLKDVVTAYREGLDDAGKIGTVQQALQGSGEVITTVRLKRRPGPNVSAESQVFKLAGKDVIPAGTTLKIDGIVQGDTVSGNDDWCKIAESSGGGYCWSGGVKPAPAPAAALVGAG